MKNESNTDARAAKLAASLWAVDRETRRYHRKLAGQESWSTFSMPKAISLHIGTSNSLSEAVGSIDAPASKEPSAATPGLLGGGVA